MISIGLKKSVEVYVWKIYKKKLKITWIIEII